MNRLRWRGNWTLFRGWLRKSWGRLLGSDRRYVQGRELEFCGRMQRCVGRVRDGVARDCRRRDPHRSHHRLHRR